MGTPSYMAPEQAWGKTHEVGPKADQYALGVILYEMLVGRPPLQGAGNMETLDLVRTQEPVPPRRLQPKVPADLETICLKCLQKEPARRYDDVVALADDLQRFLDGEAILRGPSRRSRRPGDGAGGIPARRPSPRRPRDCWRRSPSGRRSPRWSSASGTPRSCKRTARSSERTNCWASR